MELWYIWVVFTIVGILGDARITIGLIRIQSGSIALYSRGVRERRIILLLLNSSMALWTVMAVVWSVTHIYRITTEFFPVLIIFILFGLYTAYLSIKATK